MSGCTELREVNVEFPSEGRESEGGERGTTAMRRRTTWEALNTFGPNLEGGFIANNMKTGNIAIWRAEVGHFEKCFTYHQILQDQRSIHL